MYTYVLSLFYFLSLKSLSLSCFYVISLTFVLREMQILYSKNLIFPDLNIRMNDTFHDFFRSHRFPIPDLRPASDSSRLPHWQLHLHKDIAWLQLSDLCARSSVTSRQLGASFELSAQRGVVLFQEAGTEEAVPFGYTSYEETEYIHDVGWPRCVPKLPNFFR